MEEYWHDQEQDEEDAEKNEQGEAWEQRHRNTFGRNILGMGSGTWVLRVPQGSPRRSTWVLRATRADSPILTPFARKTDDLSL